MGEAFLVESTTSPEAKSVLKVISAKHAHNPEYLARFHREADIARQLTSPHVARLHDFKLYDRMPVARWQYIPGPTLEQLIRMIGRMEVRRALRIAIQLTDALVDIHRVAFHRDIKPGNLILQTLGDTERLYVLDFGLARGHNDGSLTSEGEMHGTLRYTPPDIVKGSVAWQANHDLYAAAAVLYELIVGAPPFHASSPAALIHAIVHNEPSWSYPLTGLNDASAALQRTLRRALSKDPAERHATAEQLRTDLVLALALFDAEGSADTAALPTANSHPPEASDAADNFLAPYLQRASRAFAEAEQRFSAIPSQSALIRTRAVAMLEHVEATAERLRSGELVTNYHDCALLSDCVATMGEGDKLIGLTTWESDYSWWQSADANRFRLANAQAVERKAFVRRIFVYRAFPDAHSTLHELAEEMEQHANMGVHLRSIEHQRLPSHTAELRSQCVLTTHLTSKDIDWLAYRVTVDTTGHPMQNVFTLRASEIDQSKRMLEAIWAAATPYRSYSRRKPKRIRSQEEEAECGADAFGSCDAPQDTLSLEQLVKPEQNDGRRLYIHESSFVDLALQSTRAALIIYSTLVSVPVLKLLHHDIIEDAVIMGEFREESATDLERAIGRQWFSTLSDTFRALGVTPKRIGGTNEPPTEPLLHVDEQIVATCFDSNYYTFATTTESAARMYKDVLRLSKVDRYVSKGGDAYRDVTFLKGPRLRLLDESVRLGTPRRPTDRVAEEQLLNIKIRVFAKFASELRAIAERAIQTPTLSEAVALNAFITKCERVVRETVLRLRISAAAGAPRRVSEST